MKKILAVSAFAVALSGGSAWAACEYNGVYYETGTEACFDGRLQVCTIADYWDDLGPCEAPGAAEPVDQTRVFDTDTLFARALGTYRKPVRLVSPVQ